MERAISALFALLLMAIDLGWSEVAISLDDQLEFAAVDGHDAQGERLRASNCGTSDV